ncbi:MAG: phycobilisome rod-core linker polypeptide CpcG [Acaryochloridaceae cyanobacterium RL_2_7]|nr:phycobilisome rod-core linker polypeptide CpcG [Acaryochloridaceae cyanobacterium RL_2_7]
MTLPLIEYPSTSRNYRVSSFEVQGDSSPRVFSVDLDLSATDFDNLIQAAYRQIFNQQHFTASSRLKALESQLRDGQITVRDFIRELVVSSHFRTRNYDTNNNYRFVQMCFQRVLGRDVENDREKMAWSIVLATQGLEGFASELVNSEEYIRTFGVQTVPYQRRRSIAQRPIGEVSFEHMARYDANHLAQLKALGNDFDRKGGIFMSPNGGMPPEVARKVGAVLTYAGASLLTLGVVATFLSWIGLIKL